MRRSCSPSCVWCLTDPGFADRASCRYKGSISTNGEPPTSPHSPRVRSFPFDVPLPPAYHQSFPRRVLKPYVVTTSARNFAQLLRCSPVSNCNLNALQDRTTPGLSTAFMGYLGQAGRTRRSTTRFGSLSREGLGRGETKSRFSSTWVPPSMFLLVGRPCFASWVARG